MLRYDGTGERGMTDIGAAASGLQQKQEQHGGGEGTCDNTLTEQGQHSSGSTGIGGRDSLKISYNKENLASPHCVFMGRCSM